MSEETEVNNKSEGSLAPPADSSEPDEQDPLVARAEEAARRIEEANASMERQIKQLQALKVKAALGGQADAGTEKKEETPREYVERLRAQNRL